MRKIISINPPPIDKRCECCYKDIKNLKPFGKAGDPLVGDFDKQLLVKSFRPMSITPNEEQLKTLTQDEQSMYEQASSTVGASWECRDCIVLDDKEYFKTKFNL